MSKRLYFGFAALQISYWCFHASFICYASAFFLERGIGSSVVSLLLAGYLLCSFIGSVVWGAVCDAVGTNKKVFLLGLIVSAALMVIIYAFGSTVPVLAVAYPLLGFFFLPQSANSEAWLLSACNHDQKTYGMIRSTPSLVYAVWAMLMGRMIDALGYSVMLAGGTAFAVVVLLSAFLLPDAVRGKAKRESRPGIQALCELMDNGPFRRLVVLLFFTGLAVAPLNNMKIVVLQSVGGSVTHMGMDSFVSALTQVPFFMLSGSLQRIPLRIRYAVMTLGPLVMILMCLFAVSPAMVIIGSFAYNVAYGVMIPTMREVTERCVQPERRNLGHTLSDAVFTSLSGVISLGYAGLLVDGFGVRAMLVVCAAIAAIPFVMNALRAQE